MLKLFPPQSGGGRIETDPEADGIELAAEYDRAMRAYVVFRIPPGLSREEDDRLGWQKHLLCLEMVDARDALRVHIVEHGPVDTASGTYRLDGRLKLTFRLHHHPEIERTPCPN